MKFYICKESRMANTYYLTANKQGRNSSTDKVEITEKEYEQYKESWVVFDKAQTILERKYKGQIMTGYIIVWVLTAQMLSSPIYIPFENTIFTNESNCIFWKDRDIDMINDYMDELDIYIEVPPEFHVQVVCATRYRGA